MVACPSCWRRWVVQDLDELNQPEILKFAAEHDVDIVAERKRRRALKRRKDREVEDATGMNPRMAHIVTLFKRTACPHCSGTSETYQHQARKLTDFQSTYINTAYPLTTIPGYPTPTDPLLVSEVAASDALVLRKGLSATGFLRQDVGEWPGAAVFNPGLVPRPAVPRSYAQYQLMVGYAKQLLQVVIDRLCAGYDRNGVWGYCFTNDPVTFRMAALANYSYNQFSTYINDPPDEQWADLAAARMLVDDGEGTYVTVFDRHAAARFVLGQEMCDSYEVRSAMRRD